MKIVATTSFASSRPPERRSLERRTLVPIVTLLLCQAATVTLCEVLWVPVVGQGKKSQVRKHCWQDQWEEADSVELFSGTTICKHQNTILISFQGKKLLWNDIPEMIVFIFHNYSLLHLSWYSFIVTESSPRLHEKYSIKKIFQQL